MPQRRIFPTASISICAVLVAAAAHAAPYPVDTISFGSDPVTFPTGTVSFPSGPVQTETATTIEVTLPADILFDFDKADIRSSAQSALHEVAQLLRERAHGPVTIQGYTDALGSESYNQRLSERRAIAVKTWLGSNEGLANMRFTIVGFGARNPVAPNRKPDGSDDPEGRQRNRRVTFIISK
ncbi:MAG: OmpA family protein [Proteobacteria bacterium]|nr:OmpA family protein [Pseudomonadota bacterium]